MTRLFSRDDGGGLLPVLVGLASGLFWLLLGDPPVVSALPKSVCSVRVWLSFGKKTRKMFCSLAHLRPVVAEPVRVAERPKRLEHPKHGDKLLCLGILRVSSVAAVSKRHTVTTTTHLSAAVNTGMAQSLAALWTACLQDLQLLADGVLSRSAAAAASGRVHGLLGSLEEDGSLSSATGKKLLREMKVRCAQLFICNTNRLHINNWATQPRSALTKAMVPPPLDSAALRCRCRRRCAACCAARHRPG